ncbi:MULTISPECIES: carbohydrate ABC transporter permease [unclassified Coleofasciculus]|uniref:carbohydrate ABC transporter permease n=1 Tax=unclassified Coleofasciculus TaxID=2692782 RepID=UPI00187EB8FE|nr:MULTISPECIES: carbohydrate ABC transporter permease [unclassified Coleofasciculus]MBE9124813.1 carbohydrate ABC transporter permease [Coleofasciculus sp. LEGE 07081]MBE9147718.1 carbohydrate ABC transporter permease [Coleofasciculus sp. LEGE 07092]
MAVAQKPTATEKGSGISLQRIGLWVGVVLIVVFCLAPVLWQLLTSFKVNEAISAVPNIYFPSPNQLTTEHYTDLGWKFFRYVFNSAFVSFTSTLLCLAVGAPAAYTLARLRIPGEQIILACVLIISLFPYVLLFLGLLEVVKAVGLGNNYLALIIPYTAINLPLTILVLRSFFQQLPKDLEDSAKVDGYNTIQMLLKIVLPMTVPALVTTGILTFIFAWNEFIFALTFITRDSMKTIPVAVAQIGGASAFEIPYGPIAAATIAGTFPLIVLVLLFQRRIVQGITAGAVKG